MPLTIAKAGDTSAKVPFKATLYGPQGAGKTFTALLWGEALAARRKGRLLFVDTEHGSDKYALTVPQRQVHPEGFDFDIAHSRSFADLLETLPNTPHTCIVIDSMSHLWDAAFEAWEARNPGRRAELRDWGPIKRPYKNLMRWVTSTGCDVILCGRQKHMFEDSGEGLRRTGVAMRAESETPYETDVVGRLEQEKNQSTGALDPVLIVEKDRWGILAGRRYVKPNADTIAPIFPFLGTEAPTPEDEEERLAADGALVDEETDKAKAKVEKSGTIYADLQARVTTAASPEALGAVTAEIKKLKRHLTAEHVDALRVLHEAKAKELLQAAAGSV